MYHYYAQQGAKSKKLPFHKNNWTPKIDQDLSKIKSCAVKLLPIWSSVSVSVIFGVLKFLYESDDIVAHVQCFEYKLFFIYVHS